MLHITNGDAAGSRMEASGLAGRVLSWGDVLHDGPVPGGISDDELYDLRAGFIGPALEPADRAARRRGRS